MSEYYQSHCYRLSSTSRYTNLIGINSRPHCGFRAAGARFPLPKPGFEVESCRFACSQFHEVTALAFGGRKQGGCFCATLPPINGQPRKFRLLYRNLMRFRLDDL